MNNTLKGIPTGAAEPDARPANTASANALARSQALTSWLDRPVIATLDWEKLIYLAFIFIAIASRFWDMGARVMSHDESLHTVYSNNIALGKGFQHTPLMHGPFLFHIVALSYFLFGADDFTSRLPYAVFGVILVALPYFFRRELGRVGAIVTAFTILISPSLLYHARYIRQEGSVVVWTVLAVLFVWRFLESRQFGWLVGLSAVLALHGTDKSTNFFSVATLTVFLAPLAVLQMVAARAARSTVVKSLGYAALVGGAMLVLSVGFEMVSSKALVPLLNPRPVLQTGGNVSIGIDAATGVYAALLLALGVGACAGLVWLIRRFFGAWLAEVEERAPAFHVLIVLVTTTMFMASAAMLLVLNPIWKVLNGGQELIAVKLLGEMGNFSSNMQLITTMFALNVALAAVAAAVGLTWNWKRWLAVIGIYLAITTTLFTTIFTNATGVGTGFVGQLGYWMAQQDVKRGSQPWYYYALLAPLYEYLVVLGAACAAGLVAALAVRKLWRPRAEATPQTAYAAPAMSSAGGVAMSATPIPAQRAAPAMREQRIAIGPIEFKYKTAVKEPEASRRTSDAGKSVSSGATAQPLPLADLIAPTRIFPVFLLWWAISTFAIYTIAGEKMPWLITHIALPLTFLTGYFVNWLVTTAKWRAAGRRSAWALAGLAVLGVVLFVRALALVGGVNTVNASQAESVSFATNLVLNVLLLGGVLYLMARLGTGVAIRSLVLAFFGLLSILTIRTAVMVTYLNYDYAKEFLFYAHGAPGIKIAVNQMMDLSKRMTGGDGLKIGYESDVSWPMSWYMKDFPGSRFMGSELSNDFNSFDVILIGDYNQKREDMYRKLEPGFTRFDYYQVWWPMQDYMDLTWERIRYSLVNPKARAALWEIVFNRNFKPYAELFNKSALTDAKWEPSHGFSMWVRNDIASKVWDYRVGAVAAGNAGDKVEPVQTQPQSQPLALQQPSSIALAPNGDQYALDRKTARVLHFNANGAAEGSFGGFGSRTGQFNDPWGLAIDAAGNIIVADTFNHRVQKFDKDGNFIWAAGAPGMTNNPGSGRNTQFFGPRDIVIDKKGNLLISDTGNKRVQVLDPDGNFITQFGKAGAGNGEFDEPVGIALDAAGNIYVADVWNKRIQAFDPNFNFVRAWAVDAWTNMKDNELRAVDHKPFMQVSGDVLYVTSPRTRQVLGYTLAGKPVDLPQIAFDPGALPTGIDIRDGRMFVTNGAGGSLVEFQLK